MKLADVIPTGASVIFDTCVKLAMEMTSGCGCGSGCGCFQ